MVVQRENLADLLCVMCDVCFLVPTEWLSGWKKICQGTDENASACAMCVRGCNALIGSVSWTCGGT